MHQVEGNWIHKTPVLHINEMYTIVLNYTILSHWYIIMVSRSCNNNYYGGSLQLYGMINFQNSPLFNLIDSAWFSRGVFLWYAAAQFKGQHQIDGVEDDKSSRNVGGVTGTVDSNSSVCYFAVNMKAVFTGNWASGNTWSIEEFGCLVSKKTHIMYIYIYIIYVCVWI